MTLPTISAIVVTYHTGQVLRECLYALKSDPDISEIIIVDNGNPPRDETWLDDFSARFASVQLIRRGENRGFGAAINLGARSALGEVLLIINPDAIIRRGSLPAMIKASQGLPRPWIVGGRIFNIQGEEERGCRRNTLTLWNALGLGQWALNKTHPPEAPIAVGAISGAFFITHRKSFRDMGGFDEAYFLHVEDVDLCRRTRQAGGAVIYQPEAGALHYGATSDVPSAQIQAHKITSLKHYFSKFAAGPFERVMAKLVMPFIGLALKHRA